MNWKPAQSHPAPEDWLLDDLDSDDSLTPDWPETSDSEDSEDSDDDDGLLLLDGELLLEGLLDDDGDELLLLDGELLLDDDEGQQPKATMVGFWSADAGVRHFDAPKGGHDPSPRGMPGA